MSGAFEQLQIDARHFRHKPLSMQRGIEDAVLGSVQDADRHGESLVAGLGMPTRSCSAAVTSIDAPMKARGRKLNSPPPRVAKSAGTGCGPNKVLSARSRL